MLSSANWLSVALLLSYAVTAAAASSKPAPGFQVIWKDKQGRRIEFRGEGTQSYAKVTLQAKGFRSAANARSAMDQATPQVIEMFRRLPQYKGKRIVEKSDSRRNAMQGAAFIRHFELTIGNAKARRTPKTNPKTPPRTRPAPPQHVTKPATFTEARPPSGYSPQLGQASASVVRIVQFGRVDSKGSPIYGSGWFISPYGHLVTNCHVYDGSGGGKTAVVAVADNRSYRITGRVLADRKRDIIVLKVDAQDIP